MFKVIKVILILLGLAVVIFFGVIYFFGKGMGNAVHEGGEYGQSSNQNQCLEESAYRASKCGGEVCSANVILFGAACLSVAKKSSPRICVSEKRIDSIASKYCKIYDGDQDCEATLYNLMVAHCDSN